MASLSDALVRRLFVPSPYDRFCEQDFPSKLALDTMAGSCPTTAMKIVRLILSLMLSSFSFISARAQTADTPLKLEHFDPNQADRTLDLCQDFYKFACHKWFAANPIPPDQAYWDTTSNLQLWNETILRETMQAASAKSASRTPVHQKIGDFWSACIDEKTIDVADMRDLKPELRRIDALGAKSDLADEIAHLHTTLPAAWQPDDNQTPAPLFGFGSNQDLDDASLVIVLIDQGGMGLPGRDFYLNEDSKSAALRSRYRQHIEKMLSLTGRSSVEAAGDAEKVLASHRDRNGESRHGQCKPPRSKEPQQQDDSCASTSAHPVV
jgi:predicted metalloendopeptidase